MRTTTASFSKIRVKVDDSDKHTSLLRAIDYHD
jgi:hypothetical protein